MPRLPLLLLLAGNAPPAAEPNRPHETHVAASEEQNPMKIQIHVGARSLTATLENSKAARDFLSLLPLTLTLSDYNSTEKVADLPRKLSTEGAPDGTDPDVGDLTYYAPWGNLAIFYRDFGWSRGLVKLGRLDAGVELLRAPSPVEVTIERAER